MGKTLEWWQSRGYNYHPKVSFLLHTHNLSDMAIQIVNDLRWMKSAEIIAMDDGSEHDHTKRLLDHLVGVNEFVIHPNDLCDVIVFNRVISFARGEYVVVIQDDDEYKGKEWVQRAIAIMEKDPKIAILGGRSRLRVSKGGEKSVERRGAFQYAQVVNAAPLWLRRSAFLELGGFDLDFAPYSWHEGALCMEAWLNGYHVGWYESRVGICALSTPERRKLSFPMRKQAEWRSLDLFFGKYDDRLDEVQKLVDRANAR